MVAHATRERSEQRNTSSFPGRGQDEGEIAREGAEEERVKGWWYVRKKGGGRGEGVEEVVLRTREGGEGELGKETGK